MTSSVNHAPHHNVLVWNNKHSSCSLEPECSSPLSQCFSFRSLSSAVASPSRLVGAAVIGALVLLQVIVALAEASIHQKVPLHAHRISSELIKCTCKEKFCGVLSRDQIRALAVISVLTSSLRYIPACVNKSECRC